MGSLCDMSAAQGLGRAAANLRRSLHATSMKARAAEFGRTLRAEYEAGKSGAPDVDDATSTSTDDADAAAVAEAMQGVDWAKVRAATSEKGAEAAHAMKSMAAEVDWDKVQPVAAKVSSALIAAVASGQLGIGGRFAAPVARAIMNDRNLAGRVSANLAASDAVAPPDFLPAIRDGVIDTTAREA